MGRQLVSLGKRALWIFPLLVACSDDPSAHHLSDASASDARKVHADGSVSDAAKLDAADGSVSDAGQGDVADASVSDAGQGDVSDESASDAGQGDVADASVSDTGGADVSQPGDAGIDASIGDANADRQDPPPDGGDGRTGALSCISGSIGIAGATVTHPAGAQLVVPNGALLSVTSVSLCSDPTVQAGALGRVFRAGPQGQSFLKPVELAVPFDPTRLAAGTGLSTVQVRMASNASPNSTALQSRVDLAARLVRASTIHFSEFVAAQTANPISISSPAVLTGAIQGTAYFEQLTVSGGTSPYVWSVDDPTSLPPGVSLTTAGVLNGTPSDWGNFAFFVTVSDSDNASVKMAILLMVLPATNPDPLLRGVTPSLIFVGSGDTVITISGLGLLPVSRVLLGGMYTSSTFVDLTQLVALVPASELSYPHGLLVSVENPPPGGGFTSTTINVNYETINPTPSVASIEPTLVPVGSPGAQIRITGSNFMPTSSVAVGSSPGIFANILSASELTAAIPEAYFSSAGALKISVCNPPPGGGCSAPVTLTVGSPNPVPQLVSLTPPSVSAGTGLFTLSLSGTNFVRGATTFLGNTSVVTAYRTDALLEATIPGYLVGSPGSVNVRVVNPSPGGGTSGIVAFSVTAP